MGGNYGIPPKGYYENSKNIYDILADIYGEYTTARNGIRKLFGKKAELTPAVVDPAPHGIEGDDSHTPIA